MDKIKILILLGIFVFSSAIKFQTGVGISLFDFVFVFILFRLILIGKISYKNNFKNYFLPIIVIQFIPLLFYGVSESIRYLYALRFFEYMIVLYYFYASFSRKLKESHVNIFFLIVGLILLIAEFSSIQYFPFSYRWEYAAFFSLGFVFILSKKEKKYYHYLLLLFYLFFVIKSNQRTPFLAVLICSIIYISRFINLKTITIYPILIFMIYFIFSKNLTESRIYFFILNFNFENFKSALDVINTDSSMYDNYGDYVYSNRQLVSGEGDLSLELRLKKWLFAFNKLEIKSIFFGLGPGFFGGAADSSFLRIFFEIGVIGCFFWYKLLAFVKEKIDYVFFICIILNATLIDTFYSSKILITSLILIICYEHRNRLSSI